MNIQDYRCEMAAVAQPSRFQRLLSGIGMSAAAQAVSPWANNPMFIDISDYQPQVNFEQVKDGGMSLVVIKACEFEWTVAEGERAQKYFAQNVQRVYDVGLPYAPYIYLNGQWGLDEDYTLDAFKLLERKDNHEYQLFRQVMQFKAKPAFYAIDLERWYANNSKFWAWRNNKITQAEIPVISPNWIYENLKLFIRHLREGMKVGELLPAPIVIYTGRWFVEGYMKSGNQNLFYNQAPNWEADGIRLWFAKYRTDWMGVSSTWERVTKDYRPDNVLFKPDYCNFTAPSFWQIGIFKLPNSAAPGGATNFDMNLSLMPKAQFDEFIGATVTPPPPPPPTDLEAWADSIDAQVGMLGIDVNALKAKVAELERLAAYLKAYK